MLLYYHQLLYILHTTVRHRTLTNIIVIRANTTTTSSRRREAAATATATTAKGMGMRRPSIEALAMADADWAQHCDLDDDDQEGVPPEHLRAFEAFIDAVVPVDMVLAFGREQSARARRGERRRPSHQEDVKEKLKLWAKAVAAKARQDIIKHKNRNACLPHGV